MPRREPIDAAASRAITYCIVPRDLAPRLYDQLRRHFQDDPGVEVVVEQRRRDRRRTGDRRVSSTDAPPVERRLIRASDGRRVADRRATAVAVAADPVGLPRRARPFADRLVYVERVEPSTQQLEDVDTARLVMRFQSGDRDAFSSLYMRYFDRVYGYLRVMLGDPHEAENVTQQVFVRVLEAISQYERRDRQPFRAWLFTVARNVAVSELRKTGRLASVDPDEINRQREGSRPESPADLISLEWMSDRELMMLVERLPLAQRQVLFLRFVLDLAYSDVAAILERTEEDVRSLQSRAIRFLRARLAALGRPSRDRNPSRVRACLRRAPVLHGRRWALS